ncbi:MAG: rRNA maturation RNase YbeY [Alphaproteobacteria bacterium RIFCSPLOWO2_01_FULL_40_26]|nr:MAG: rRNA maturation RNase YbeY [Alphaproteobacteria bacterium RIFCSPHIGHO2_02_FULL_40_34]OFW86683.1 MAG: rRNA maturation RNase YbeY [Alphaproteobacteria bacterium RIFCSPHIGHO2_01_FULL_40_8]OFW94044.1 MAG: rRNA maturation RNase YbeY [Alphaproteobacteria bacterium RIFCSPLOWO2_01_FULL_40_26]OFX09578.1 MAG: rRNA maturation RNase YbeY [Alphaproteobacteria bacterium RIFCSPLOWO2_02_FULL_40_19]OFX11007.1 MAG: rRNA maturation RNase YbeY [Alphaproteobacteria bacterium RIFCSPLOWO2_12_FULL_40_11]
MIEIDIATKSKKWRGLENLVKKTCLKLIPITELKKLLKKNIRLELAILLVSDLQMKKINFKFRQKNQPTNILSFPAQTKSIGNHLFLGDIVISIDRLQKESLAQKKKFEHHLTHLILHSILHLLGHDHEDETSAKKMENLEIKILQKLRIKNPYQ